ncbi:VPLPA-CTERM sorting domain-containing protein [uncultured Roseobacter sp.]|uniref:VPLPA-CTERM sorting domain-containing protein n=1 Tax=uncultured Roseobacter sp. TaxID=114847 RepID=UPI002612150F|nr:VPLPA-CTERM sorting domain-containing protein [uncultured Roseobacter sp.]
MKKTLFSTILLIWSLAGATQAATLSGLFEVGVVHTTNMNSADSQATLENLIREAGTAAPGSIDTFQYEGELNFGTFNGDDSTTIAGWLSTGGGTVTGLDIGDLQLSTDSIGNSTATTTFFLFSATFPLDSGEFVVRHDDGIAFFQNGSTEPFGESRGPTSEITTDISGFSGGSLEILYVATNGNPSVLNVDYEPTPVPLPASLPMMILGMFGLGVLAHKRKTL